MCHCGACRSAAPLFARLLPLARHPFESSAPVVKLWSVAPRYIGRHGHVHGSGAIWRRFGDGLRTRTTVLELPFVVLLDEHRADQPDDRGFIETDAAGRCRFAGHSNDATW